MSAATRPERPRVSLVVPVLDEEACVAEFARRARQVLSAADLPYEVLFVDDGSRDGTADQIAKARDVDPAVKTVRFTRSFGHQAALAAGLRFARGDVVVTLDGDLQHPPELVADLLEAWRGGADVVHAVRRQPPGWREGWKGRSSRLFYRAMSFLAATPLVAAGADFRLLDRRVVDAFNELEEGFVFVRGLVPWLGFRETRIAYDVEERLAGESKYDARRMLRLALDGVFAFSVAPLRLISLLGLATTLFSIAFGIFWLVSWFLGGVEGRGWTSLVVLVLLFGGVQLLSIGILSEYVGRTFAEVKRRPRYVIDTTSGTDEE